MALMADPDPNYHDTRPGDMGDPPPARSHFIVPLSIVPSRSGIVADGVGLDDADEMGWMYISMPRTPKTAAEQLASKLKTFKKMTKWERKFVRICVKQGMASLFVYENDDLDDAPIAVFDCSLVVNVRKITVPEDQSLQFISFDQDSNSFVESVYGQIGFALEFTKEGQIDSYLDMDGNWSAVNHNDGGSPNNRGGSPERNPSSSAPMGGTPSYLHTGKTQDVRLALKTTTERDAWATWFSELVVLRDLFDIENAAIEERGHEMVIDPIPGFLMTAPGKRALRDYNRIFLQGSGGVGGKYSQNGDGLPNKGRILVRPPGSKAFSMQTVTGNMRVSEVRFTPKRKKTDFLGLGRSNSKVPGILLLSESTLITAQLPWSPEFLVILDQSRVWTFEARGVEQRNSFIQWFRLVKGKGKLAQTEHETFPYYSATEGQMSNADEMSENIRLHFLRSGEQKQEKKQKVKINGDGEEDDEDEEDEDWSDGWDEDSPPGSPGSSEGGRSRRSRSANSNNASPSRSRTLSAKEREENALYEQLSTISTPRSDEGSVHSIRTFQFFPLYVEKAVDEHVEETLIPHRLGRKKQAGLGGGGGGGGGLYGSKSGSSSAGAGLFPRQRSLSSGNKMMDTTAGGGGGGGGASSSSPRNQQHNSSQHSPIRHLHHRPHTSSGRDGDDHSPHHHHRIPVVPSPKLLAVGSRFYQGPLYKENLSSRLRSLSPGAGTPGGKKKGPSTPGGKTNNSKQTIKGTPTSPRNTTTAATSSLGMKTPSQHQFAAAAATVVHQHNNALAATEYWRQRQSRNQTKATVCPKGTFSSQATVAVVEGLRRSRPWLNVGDGTDGGGSAAAAHYHHHFPDWYEDVSESHY